ncbi:hypothetical protein IG631_08307 [Alternaria alternata]|nr:hypothetical protein IG631_08307 [Alternaria alternata]
MPSQPLNASAPAKQGSHPSARRRAHRRLHHVGRKGGMVAYLTPRPALLVTEYPVT